MGSWVSRFGLRGTISSCSTNYGPWQHIDGFLPRTIATVLDGGRPQVQLDGRGGTRGWIHVDDHVSALLLTLRGGRIGRNYLIQAGRTRSDLDVAGAVLRLCGRDESDYDVVRRSTRHHRRHVIDPTFKPLSDDIYWKPRYRDFEVGLAATVAWYRDNESWWRPLQERATAYAALSP